jgi:hypothetical protein
MNVRVVFYSPEWPVCKELELRRRAVAQDEAAMKVAGKSKNALD